MSIDEEVARLLESPAVQRINFHCGPTRAWGGGYQRVANAIRRPVAEGHRVSVYTNTILQQRGEGSYNESYGPNFTNILQLPFFSMHSVKERALAVHEATHALQDFCANSMSVEDSECAAYIAHMMYVHIAAGRFVYSVSDVRDPAQLDVFLTAYNAAVRILTTQGGYEVSAEEQRQIKTGLANANLYSGRLSDTIDYNGL